MIIIRAKKMGVLKSKVETLAQIRRDLKESPIIQQTCKDYKLPIDIIDGIPIDFIELDVSAKTIDSKIYLNEDLLSEDYDVIMRYAIHEVTHSLQHMEREDLDKDPYADDEYLDRPDEKEAFANQFAFMIGDTDLEDLDLEDMLNKLQGPAKKDFLEYIIRLLDHHDIPRSERYDKIEEIMKA